MVKLPSLIWSVALSAVLAATCGALLLVATVQHFTGEAKKGAHVSVAEHAAKAMQLTATSALQREWNAMSKFAPQLGASAYADPRSVMNSIVQSSDAVDWAGIATVSGDIVVSSGGTHEGTNVASREWFAMGLQEGGVHFSPADGLINLSMPMQSQDGVTNGVLTYSVRAEWLQQEIGESASMLGVDFAVLTLEGQLVAQQQALVEAPFDTRLLHLANDAQLVVSEQAGAHTVSVVPYSSAKSIPNIGWSIVVRVPAHMPPSSFIGTLIEMQNVVLALVGVILACASFFAVSFLLPISRLAHDAKLIADGKKICPTNLATSHEAAQISSALARLQSVAETAKLTRDPVAISGQRQLPPLKLVVGQN